MQTITSQIPFIKNENDSDDLARKIDAYISEHEANQLEKLNQLAIISKSVYGFDKTMEMYSENIGIFQSFFTMKAELSSLNEHFVIDAEKKREEERIKHQNEEAQEREEAEVNRLKEIQIKNIQREDQLRREEEIIQRQQLETAEFEYYEAVSTQEAPRFIRELCDATITEGDKHIFECEVVGNPTPLVEWFRDSISVASYPDYISRYDNGICILIIDETLLDDSAVFICKATNSLGEAQTKTRLFVKEVDHNNIMVPPHFTKYLQNCSIPEASSLFIDCLVEGNPLPTVQWFKNGDCIDHSPKYAITYNNGEAVINFDEINRDDEAVYTCKASNPLGDVQCSATLHVMGEIRGQY